MSRIRLVCFDVGGVVIRVCRTWEEGCAAAGLPVRDPDPGEHTRPQRRALVVEHQTGRIDAETFAARTSALLCGLYSPAEIRGVHRAWLLDEYEGVLDLVDRLHAADLDTAALSNTNHDHWSRMGDYPAVVRIRHHLTSHRLGLHKPDPAIYRRLEQLLGYGGEEILFFDDTEENVIAARELGWRAAVIDPAGEPARQMEDVVRGEGLEI